jgi:hypothetical protein
MSGAKHSGSPGSHPHEDQPNWRPATTIGEYLHNCREGLETFSQRRAAVLMGMPRSWVQRAILLAELPEELFEGLLAAGVSSTRQLSNVARMRRGGHRAADVETCPHCGETLRVRPLVSAEAAHLLASLGGGAS